MDLTASLARSLGLLDGAGRIARSILASALWTDNGCTWLAVDRWFLGGPPQLSAKLMDLSVYDGSAGVLTFLAHYAQLAGDAAAHHTCLAILRQIAAGLPRQGYDLGLYTGTGGTVIAALDAVTELGLDPGPWQEIARHYLPSPAPTHCDLLDGLSGAVLVCLRLYGFTADPHFLDRAVELGSQLIRSGTANGERLSWRSSCPSSQDLTGLAHGSSGPILALAELYGCTCDAQFLDAARAGIAYEDSCFIAAQQNWPDFRVMPGNGEQQTTICGNAWCHGAAGIILARARLYELSGDPQDLAKTLPALETLRRSIDSMLLYPPSSQGLCHSLAGNAIVLHYLGRLTSDWRLTCDALRAANGLLRIRLTGDPAHTGQPVADSAGAMLGLAGNGWLLLGMAGVSGAENLLLGYPQAMAGVNGQRARTGNKAIPPVLPKSRQSSRDTA